MNKLDLIENIYIYARKKTAFTLIGHAANFCILLIVLWLGVALADHFFYFSEFTRWGLWLLNALIVYYLFRKFILLPLFAYQRLKKNSDLSGYASEIGQLNPMSQDRLLNAYHLLTRPQSAGVSRELTLSAAQSLCNQYKNSDFASRLKIKHYTPKLRLVIPVLVSLLIVLFTVGSGLFHSTLRLLNPTNEYLLIPPYSFHVVPGTTSHLKNLDMRIGAAYRGPRLQSVNLYIMNSEDDPSPRILNMTVQSDSFFTVLRDIRSSFFYKMKGNPLKNPGLNNRIWSDTHHINIITLPMVRNLDVKITPPVYTGLDVLHLDRNIGDFLALAGSRAELRIESDKPLATAQIAFSSGKKIEMSGKNLAFRVSFPVNSNGSYHFELTDTAGLQNVNPIEHQFSLLHDAIPFVEITDPGKDIEASLDATLKINASAYDDYGIKSAFLVHRNVRRSKFYEDTTWVRTPLHTSGGNKQHGEFQFLWNFNELPLSFDDGLEYYVMVEDNRLGKPGIGLSRIFMIHFPSLDDIFADVDDQQRDHTDRLEELSKKSEELQKSLQEIRRDLKREKNLDWEKKQQIQQAMERQEKLQKDLQEIKKELEDTIQKLEKNNAISDELLERYSEVLNLFEQIATPELLKAISELQKAMAENNMNKTNRALDNFQINQEAFKKQLDRTHELLKKAHLEQKMDQLVQVAEDLTRQQKKIGAELSEKNLNPEEMSQRLRDNEMRIEQRLEQLKQQVDELKKDQQLAEYNDSRGHLDEASRQMADSKLKSQMESTKEALANQQQMQSQAGAEGLEDKLQQIESSLTQARQSMLDQSKKAIEEKMQNMMDKMLTLSHEQERLQKKTQQTSPLGNELQDVTRKQGQITNNFHRMISEMIELSNETFHIGRDIGKSLGKIQHQMMRSLDQLSERDTRGAAKSQKEAMKNLNLGSQQMQSALDQLSKSKSGLGLEKFLEDMKSMANSQGKINSQSMGLIPGQNNPGGMSAERQAAMRRIAGEQNGLRQMLEEMRGQMGDRGDIAGRLGNMSKQMDEVIEDLLNNKVSRKTINRQKQILSRMLDAQKSMTERKKSKKRQAERAKTYAVKDPGQLGKTSDLEKEAIQEALKRAQNEGYSNDYQKLIEAYFKSLLLYESSAVNYETK